MAFWKKKSEDPWDVEPEKTARPAEAGEKEDAPSLLDELRDWNEDRKEKKRQREAPPPPMACPWCGQEMEVGTIIGGRDLVQWWPGWPKRVFGANGPGIHIDYEGGLLHKYKTAYLCRACRRMVLEFSEEALETEPSGWEEAPAETGSAETDSGESET